MTCVQPGNPSMAPKDSAVYRDWKRKRDEGVRYGRTPTFAPRPCVIDAVTFTPKVGNQVRCHDCIAAGRWHASAHKKQQACA